VKDFGSLMVKDHSMGGDQLKSVASSKGFMLPDSVTDKQKHERDHLLGKTGSDFDKDYVKMMVDDHKDDIKDFEKEVKDGQDADVKAFAQKMLPMLHTHLDKIEAIQKSM
jgi:putative membrane protein